MTQGRLRFLFQAIVVASAVAVAQGQSAYERHLEIRTSRIPHAGNGVFTKAPIPRGAYLGAYTGEFITEEEFLRRARENRWQYMMGLLDCAKPRTGGIATIDGINGNVFTRMNYAPAEFQNVKFEKTCEAPFVRIVALRDIAPGEELWVDYGPNYRYDFMQDPEVIKFFEALRASGPRRLAPSRRPLVSAVLPFPHRPPLVIRHDPARSHDRRRIVQVNVTAHPTADWTAQQPREAWH